MQKTTRENETAPGRNFCSRCGRLQFPNLREGGFLYCCSPETDSPRRRALAKFQELMKEQAVNLREQADDDEAAEGILTEAEHRRTVDVSDDGEA